MAELAGVNDKSVALAVMTQEAKKRLKIILRSTSTTYEEEDTEGHKGDKSTQVDVRASDRNSIKEGPFWLLTFPALHNRLLSNTRLLDKTPSNIHFQLKILKQY